jgi:hypothetical protein
LARKHPLGFFCLPVERVGITGVCLHIWSAEFPGTVATTSTVHSHSWDLISFILYGELRNEWFTAREPGITHRVFEVRSVGDRDDLLRTPRLVDLAPSGAEHHRRGDVYRLDSGVFHTTVVLGDAATVAVGTECSGRSDLSLGRPYGLDSHTVFRQLCTPELTGHLARSAIEHLARACPD